MTRAFILATVASLALGFAASSASAQTAGMHSPPSERATQGALVPSVQRGDAGRILDTNIRKTDGSIDYADGQSPRGYSVGGGGGGHGSERMGLVEEDRKLVGTTSQTYTPSR